jgi:predicted transcriptional regulator YdeE
MDDLVLRTSPAMRVAGFSVRTSNAELDTDGPGPIGALWGKLLSRTDEAPWADAPVGVYHDYESDHHGPYTLFVGYPMRAGAAVSAGWEVLDVPETECLVFRAEGEIPAALIEAWERIWAHFDDDAAHVRDYTFDVERFDEDGADIWIAARAR